MIKLLPEDVWSKIAAGEVVERPGSIVKELVENSIDVGAKRIRVSLWDGGKARIIVEDNGGGIPFSDLPLAIERHATSKLSTTEDLTSIITLGYRGEAIASIASVSKLEIRSCPEGETGGLIRVNEGHLIEHVKTTCPNGTRVQVDDLFCNIPARKKFMRASLSELRRCSLVLRDYALAWPGVSFGLSHENKTLFITDGSGNRKRALSQIWGDSPGALTTQVTSGNLSLECWYQPFPLRGRNEVSAFVNGRVVNDPIIRAAVSNAGKELSGNWALFITINPSLIDVNVHPAKAEIRFRYSGEVFDSIKKASEILSGNPAKLAFFNNPKHDRDANTHEISVKQEGRNNINFSVNTKSLFSRAASSFDTDNLSVNENRAKSWNFNEDDFVDTGCAGQNIDEPDVKFISQLSSGYLVFETPESVVVMDPHAAHERIMFEKIMAESVQGIKTQTLINPEPLQPTITIQVQELERELCSVGFSFSDENGFCVTGIPLALGNISSPSAILRATIAVWNNGGNGGKLDEQLMARWAEIACKSSVKLTSRLHSSEALELWRKLHLCKQPFSCPHGRPTILKLEYSELTKHFGR